MATRVVVGAVEATQEARRAVVKVVCWEAAAVVAEKVAATSAGGWAVTRAAHMAAARVVSRVAREAEALLVISVAVRGVMRAARMATAVVISVVLWVAREAMAPQVAVREVVETSAAVRVVAWVVAAGLTVTVPAEAATAAGAGRMVLLAAQWVGRRGGSMYCLAGLASGSAESTGRSMQPRSQSAISESGEHACRRRCT